jgi:predicted CXXCH cytochrome family protein
MTHGVMRLMFRPLSALAILAAGLPALADESVVNSKHDLSAFGPGPVRAQTESEVCIFCHAPHNTSPAAPLWNRYTPESYYRIYRSSTTDARVDQPGLASKLCLSCHDGSIALGLTITRDTEIPMNHPFMPTGPSLLTNDLSDDHPVGFRFDRQLTNRDPQLRLPDMVDHRVKLGPRGELECTACHDPHNNEYGDFLRIPNAQGALCITCHDMAGWRTSAHANSAAPIPPTLTHGQPLQFPTVGQNACNTCHVAHGALHRPRLLREQPYNLCIECHNGVSARDVLSAAGLRSGHQPQRYRNRHDPSEDPRLMTTHVDCVDCHNPHATQQIIVSQNPALARLQGPTYLATMQQVPGVSISGTPVSEARFYYEVCFRCHSDNPVPVAGRIQRDRDEFGNIRRQFAPTAASAHPVTFASRSNPADVPSLLPSARTQTLMNCQDCHNNPDARQLGGGGPNGPHGSRYPFLLVDRYETADFTTESPAAYALCYRCHDRSSILNNESFPTHERHIVRGRTPCSACHSPHGVNGNPSEHSHLVNFDLSIVGGERQFFDRGFRSGSCTLTCHGVRHVNFSY